MNVPPVEMIFFASLSTNIGEEDEDPIEELFDDIELLEESEVIEDDWDFLEEESPGAESSEEDISDSLEDLFEVKSAIDFGSDSLTIHHEASNPRSTVIIENARDEIAQFSSEKSSTPEELVPDTIITNHTLIIYDQFEELEQTITQENLLLTEELSTLDIGFPTVNHHYYETFEELEKTINRGHTSTPQVNWQQLENVINEGLDLSSPENDLEQELSDLDRLLAEAEKPSSAQKWKKNLYSRPHCPETTNL